MVREAAAEDIPPPHTALAWGEFHGLGKDVTELGFAGSPSPRPSQVPHLHAHMILQ